MSASATPTIVPGYTHVPGNHCGSTALRNLLGFHGVELTEQMVFGLGAGPCFYYVKIDDRSPSRFFNGRTARLEEEFLALTGLPLRFRTEADPDRAWAMAREAVDEGRPALLITDLYYLDHYGKSAHFPGHAVNLVGYDEETVYLSDTGFEELQETKLENLKLARHGEHPVMPLQGHMFDFPDGAGLPDPREHADAAIARAVENMRAEGMGGFAGLPALEIFAEEIGGWPDAIEDWQWCARFAYQVIERRGTGGSNFRRMYAGFLDELGRPEAGLASDAAGAWSALAETLKRASECDEPEPRLWTQIGGQAAAVLEAEQVLWNALDGS